MKFTFTSSKPMIEALVKSQEGGLKVRGISIIKCNHDSGFSECQIEFTGELSDLVFLGVWTEHTHHLGKTL